MSPRTKEQFAQMRTDRKFAIQDAAMHVFSEEGYHNASISKVAERAKISKGLLYNYYESKHELLATLLTDLFDKVIDTMELDASLELDDEKMIGYVEKTFEVVDNDRPLWKLYFSMVSQPEVMEIAKKEMLPKAEPFMIGMHTYFNSKGVEDAASIMRYFLSTMDGAKMQYLFDPETYPIQQVKKYIIKQFITT